MSQQISTSASDNDQSTSTQINRKRLQDTNESATGSKLPIKAVERVQSSRKKRIEDYDDNESMFEQVQITDQYQEQCLHTIQHHSVNQIEDAAFENVDNLMRSNIMACKENNLRWDNLVQNLKKSNMLGPEEKTKEEQRIRKARSRKNMTDVQKITENESASNRMRILRGKMTEEQRIVENEADRNRKRKFRDEITEEERNEIRVVDRIRKQKPNDHGPMYLKACSKEAEFYKLGDFSVKCDNCPAVHFPEESSKTKKGNEFLNCCKYGKIANLEDQILDYPLELKVLFDPNDDFHADQNFHKDFLINIRMLNSNFSCASLGCMRFKFPKKNIPIFKIQGAVYHSYNAIAYPESDDELPTNGQLYFVDTEEALNYRLKTIDDGLITNNKDLTVDIIAYIENSLREHYIFAHSYKMMKEVIDTAQTDLTDNDKVPDVAMLFGIKDGTDLKRYNIPKSNEVCAIMFMNANDEIPAANIIVHSKGQKQIKRIYPLDKLVEPLTYPILYPGNYHGWNCNMKDLSGKKISLCDFTKYKLHYRNEGKFLPHHFSGKLFQQWCVDQCARIEWDRLNFIKTHQKQICKEKYFGIEKMLESRAIEEGASLKKHVILPATFTGGPRYMNESFMDAMSIVNEIGNPDLFITFTCNPKDADILKCLKPWQQVHDRPDIVSRVFRLKCMQLIEEVTGKDGIFGECAGYCYSIEFQKRGLPHTHLLLTLKKEDKWQTTNDIDKFITAEIPDENADKELYDLVRTLMVHGPCGPDFSNAMCWDEKKKRCNKKYPKEFREKTELNENAYPLYKRPNNGRTIEKKYWNTGKTKMMTNKDIVPYNTYLLKRFKSHINVEKVADIKAIKYIYKYIYKGFDAACIRCVSSDGNSTKELVYDEAANYLDARYLSPVEACWRILKYPLQGKSHSIMRLPVHLENEQIVYFNEKDEDDIILEKKDKNSKLLAYFEFVNDNPTLNYKYPELPKHCTWDSVKGKWNLRKKGFANTLGRMYPVNPNEGEKYYLRYLLVHVTGTSFDDLKSFDGVKYNTFAEACLARGLTKNDEEWQMCLTEASNYRFPSALRSLFASILLFGTPKFPHLLWEEFKENLAEDFLRINSSNNAYKLALGKINKHLIHEGKNLSDFSTLPQETLEHPNDDEDIFDPSEELKIAKDRYQFMNTQQKEIFDYVEKTAIKDKKQIMIFIDGPGGCGKSYVLTSLFHLIRANGLKMINMAFSGIAATYLKQGSTLHKRFKLPLNLNAESVCGIASGTKEAKDIIECDFFVIDEIPMTPRFCLEAIDIKLRELMHLDQPFGNKNFILAGDFRQTLPVKKFSTRSEIVNLTVKYSKLWKHFTTIHLTQNVRAKNKGFASDILKIGDGTFGSGSVFNLPKECVLKNSSNLINEIYSDIFEKRNFYELKNRMIVSPYNAIVDEYNIEALEKLPGEYTTYLSIDETENFVNFPVSTEIINSFNCPGFPVHELKLKRNCKLIYLRNTNMKIGLCNGTLLQLIEPTKNLLRCIILGGDHDNEEVFIHRISLISENDFPIPLTRHQFPVRVAFAATFIKGQGATYDKIGIDWKRPSFGHGQTYTAISRVGSWDKIKAKMANDNINGEVENIVWPEVL